MAKRTPVRRHLARLAKQFEHQVEVQKKADEIDRQLGELPPGLRPFGCGFAALMSVVASTASSREAASLVVARRLSSTATAQFRRAELRERNRRK